MPAYLHWFFSLTLARQLKVTKMARQLVRWELANHHMDAIEMIFLRTQERLR